MKIKTKSGDVIDLEYMREAAGFEDIEPLQIIEVIDALEAALCIPRRTQQDHDTVYNDTVGNHGDGISAGEDLGWNDHSDAVRQAAGVIEEGEK